MRRCGGVWCDRRWGGRRRSPWRRRGRTSRAIDGPLPDSQPHHAPAARPSARAACDGGKAAKRASWCSRSAVATPRASTSPAASAATSSAVRPTLNTASENDTLPPRAPRDLCVDVACGGIHATITGSRASGTGTTRPAAVATTPPYSDAATLSAWPSSATAPSSTAAAGGGDAVRVLHALGHGGDQAADAHRPTEPEPTADRDRRAHPELALAVAAAKGHVGRVPFVDDPGARRHRTVDDADLRPQRQRHAQRVEARTEVRRRCRARGRSSPGAGGVLGHPDHRVQHLRCRAAVDRLLGRRHTLLEISGDAGDDQRGRGVEHDDVAVGAALGGEHAPHDVGVVRRVHRRRAARASPAPTPGRPGRR